MKQSGGRISTVFIINMILCKSKTLGVPAQGVRCFSIFLSRHQRSHYETLGIEENASLADVKSAYYKLSKKYHPDANLNDPSATSKFQEISEAYEILGNDELRRQYDVGMTPTSRLTTRQPSRAKVPVDPKAAFYKSRIQSKMNFPTTERAYNFDEWTKSHYTQSMRENWAMKYRTNTRSKINYKGRDEGNEKQYSSGQQKSLENKLASTIVMAIAISMLILQFYQPDTPKPLK